MFCFQEDEALFNLQVNEWDPIIQWFNKRFDVSIKKSIQMDVPTVNEKDKATIIKHLLSYNFAAINGKIQYFIDI